jgi:predicted phosphodiesterase
MSTDLRLALLSDIHGNLIALEAVLADIQAQGGVDAYWLIGDLAAIGPHPVPVLERLAQLDNVRAVRGNTDRYVTRGDRPLPSFDDALADQSLWPRLIRVGEGFAWTQGAVTAHGWFSYLDNLPVEARLTLPDGTRLLAVHASPGLDDGSGLHPDLSQAEQQQLLTGCDADLVCVGHTHWPVNWHIGDVHLINLGSVSNPRIPSLQASYAILSANRHGYDLQFRRVPYDRSAVVQAAHDIRHPSATFIARHMHGDFIPPWGEPDVY